MKISLTYQEAGRMLANQIGQNIAFSYCGEQSRVKAEFLGISLFVRVESLSDDEVVLSHQIGQDIQPTGFAGLLMRGAQIVVQETAARLLESFVRLPAVTVNEDKTIRVKLSAIEQLKGIFQNAALSDIRFEEDGITLEITML